MQLAKKKRRQKREKTWTQVVHELLNDIFLAADVFHYSTAELSRLSGLSYTTVWKLRHRVSDLMDKIELRASTLWRLAKAVGMSMKIVSTELGRAKRSAA